MSRRNISHALSYKSPCSTDEKNLRIKINKYKRTSYFVWNWSKLSWFSSWSSFSPVTATVQMMGLEGSVLLSSLNPQKNFRKVEIRLNVGTRQELWAENQYATKSVKDIGRLRSRSQFTDPYTELAASQNRTLSEG
jgi:hypothetical protein